MTGADTATDTATDIATAPNTDTATDIATAPNTDMATAIEYLGDCISDLGTSMYLWVKDGAPRDAVGPPAGVSVPIPMAVIVFPSDSSPQVERVAKLMGALTLVIALATSLVNEMKLAEAAKTGVSTCVESAEAVSA